MTKEISGATTGSPQRTFLLMTLCLALTLPLSAQQAKEYKIFLIGDNLPPQATELFDGFKTQIDKQLATLGARAVYTVFNTKSDMANVPAIIKAIEEQKPDLICDYNEGMAFVDNNIAKKLTDPKYRFVSMSAIPVEMGIIKDLKRPGGNLTGVGIFLPFNSQIRLMKSINPKVKKLAFVSWDVMAQINDWFEAELKQSCKEEGIEFVEFRRVSCAEDEFAFYSDYDKKGSEYFVMLGISAFVHRDGTPAPNMIGELADYVQKKIKKLQMVIYDETVIAKAFLAGPCVIWSDIGAQLADKGILILKGRNPGDIPWDYPRKFNILLNLQTAKDKGITIPQNIISAAYRVYTDYNGTFVQGK